MWLSYWCMKDRANYCSVGHLPRLRDARIPPRDCYSKCSGVHLWMGCSLKSIKFPRSLGICFHDFRHSAVLNGGVGDERLSSYRYLTFSFNIICRLMDDAAIDAIEHHLSYFYGLFPEFSFPECIAMLLENDLVNAVPHCAENKIQPIASAPQLLLDTTIGRCFFYHPSCWSINCD